ncbi:MAG: hypothetical protein WDO14_06105 [Bacteroidota bacterium]
MKHPHRPALLLALVLFFAPSPLLACTCGALPDVDKAVKGSSVVFTGIVLKVEYFGLGETMIFDSLVVARTLAIHAAKNFLEVPMVLKATMLVTNDFKGVKKKDTIVVYTGIRGATCGFKFETNKEYTVYGTTENYMYMFLYVDRQRFKNFSRKGIYYTSICSRTTVAVGREQASLNEHLKKK